MYIAIYYVLQDNILLSAVNDIEKIFEQFEADV